MINNVERTEKRSGKYYRLVQPSQHHSEIPKKESYIYMYSFALKPEESQPSGTCNFSRLDYANLQMDISDASKLKIYAINTNVLRIMSGQGGLAYSS